MGEVRKSKRTTALRVCPDFEFIILSGPSGSGKDTILRALLSDGWRGDGSVQVLTKFTTRRERSNEPAYCRAVRSQQFHKLQSEDRILFPYVWNDCWYGFDKRQFWSASQRRMTLFAIIGDFDIVASFKRHLRQHSINCTAIFVDAPQADLVNRATSRGLPKNQVPGRLRRIESDKLWILSNGTVALQTFDHHIDNPDCKDVRNTCSEVRRLVMRGD